MASHTSLHPTTRRCTRASGAITAARHDAQSQPGSTRHTRPPAARLEPRKNVLERFAAAGRSRLADGINFFTGRRGPLFARRYDAQPIRNLSAAAGRVAYTVNNPRNANLVETHHDWPGLLLCYGFGDTDQPTFEYLSRTAWHKDRRRKGLDKYFTPITLTLSPLPHLTDIERSAYARMVDGWIGELEQEAAKHERKSQTSKPKPAPLGIDKILDMPFDHRPEYPSFKKRPYSFGTNEEKQQYYEACSIKLARYTTASRLFRTTDRTVTFPDGMYPPPIVQAA